MTITRTEQIHLKSSDDLSSICHYAKNLYNEANYFARQQFFDCGVAPNYGEMDKLFNGKANEPSENYAELPAATAQWVLKTLKNSWTSFTRSIKDWKKHPSKYLGRPRPPKYLDKNGEFLLIFTTPKLKDGYIHFPKKTGFEPVKTSVTGKVNQVRIVPVGKGYNCEIIYKKDNRENFIKRRWYSKKFTEGNILGIDIGSTNLVTMANNIGEDPIVVKGGIVKSINQYFNKEIARLNSIKDKQGITERTKLQKALTQNRNNRIKDYMHKTSRFVINYCVEHDIGTIVIGKNDGWKQEIKIGKRNNQNFVNIPHARLIKMIQYKAEAVSINVICHEEAHTSKCSFLDNESIKHHNTYLGTRTKRGLFKTATGILINADVNGALNIIKKALPKAFADGIEGLRLTPVRVSLTNGTVNI